MRHLRNCEWRLNVAFIASISRLRVVIWTLLFIPGHDQPRRINKNHKSKKNRPLGESNFSRNHVHKCPKPGIRFSITVDFQTQNETINLKIVFQSSTVLPFHTEVRRVGCVSLLMDVLLIVQNCSCFVHVITAMLHFFKSRHQ